MEVTLGTRGSLWVVTRRNSSDLYFPKLNESHCNDRWERERLFATEVIPCMLKASAAVTTGQIPPGKKWRVGTNFLPGFGGQTSGRVHLGDFAPTETLVPQWNTSCLL